MNHYILKGPASSIPWLVNPRTPHRESCWTDSDRYSDICSHKFSESRETSGAPRRRYDSERADHGQVAADAGKAWSRNPRGIQ